MAKEITDFKGIIEKSNDFIDEYWFENLNLRRSYKQTILSYIDENYPQYSELYQKIFIKGSKEYWMDLSVQIEDYCKSNHIAHTNFFYHEELVEAKRRGNKVK